MSASSKARREMVRVERTSHLDVAAPRAPPQVALMAMVMAGVLDLADGCAKLDRARELHGELTQALTEWQWRVPVKESTWTHPRGTRHGGMTARDAALRTRLKR